MLQQYLNVTGNSSCGLSPILKNLIKNAEKCMCFPTKRRYSEVMTKFATALFIFSGPFVYKFLHRNLQQALPSTRSIQRDIHSQYKTLDEGVFRISDLVTMLMQ